MMATNKRLAGGTLVIIALVVCGCSVFSCGLAEALPRFTQREPGPTSPATAETFVTVTSTQTHTPIPTTAATRTPTRTPSPVPTFTRTRAASPTSAPTGAASRTPTLTSVPTLGAMPTPIVCADVDLDDLQKLTVEPGQRFQCTVSEERLTAQLREIPDLPCSNISATLDNGQMGLACRIFVKVSVVVALEAQDCKPVVRVVSGTAGFADVVQDMIDAELAKLPYEAACIEQISIDDGEMTVSGYGR